VLSSDAPMDAVGEFADQRALVTGAAHGIGLAIARRLHAAGATVLALDKDATRLAAAFPAGECTPVVADVGLDDPVELADRIVAEHGPIRLIVNNVGITTPRSFLELDPDEFDVVFGANLRGPWFLTRQLVRTLVASGESGSILFVTSVHDMHVRIYPHYSASKAAVSMLAKEIAYELAPHRIRVNVVAPGWIRTEEHVDPQHAEKLIHRIPIGRSGDPEDVASIAVILLSDRRSGYVTGARIPVDGGLSLHTWLMDL
jgi:NAD(P)-dependent dehydrogenase (short-subunit alcohol dehydrogenase family)